MNFHFYRSVKDPSRHQPPAQGENYSTSEFFWHFKMSKRSMNISPVQKLFSTLTQLDDLYDLQLVFIVVILGDVQHLHLEH